MRKSGKMSDYESVLGASGAYLQFSRGDGNNYDLILTNPCLPHRDFIVDKKVGC